MPDTPAWWPQVARTVHHMRNYTGQLLAGATPTLADDTLRLEFQRADGARNWEESGSGVVLDAALRHHGVSTAVEIAVSPAPAG